MRHLLALLLLTSGFAGLNTLRAQTNLFFDNFEGSHTWSVSGSNNPNTWIVGACVSSTGIKSAYISSGGTTNDCSASGIEHHGYTNAPSGSLQTIFSRSVPGTCFSALQLEFDLLTQGTAGQDYLEVVYSADNGSTWNTVGSAFTGIGTFQQQTLALPTSLNNTVFLIGFRFTYNNSGISGLPPAVDNVRIYGTTSDNTAPVATCPSTFTIYADAGCQALIPDLPPSVTVSDNCTPAANLIFTQTPAIGSTAAGNVMATVTIQDLAGNSTSCNTQFIFLDTIAPSVSCPATQNVYVGTSCNYSLADFVPITTASDNCSGSLTINQFPSPGTNIIPGNYFITMTAQDVPGNSGSCVFFLNVLDTIDPVITCPNNVNVPANYFCNAITGDITTLVTATDNCFSSNQLYYTQFPAATVQFSDTLTVSVTASDVSGNSATCQFVLHAVDTTGPIVSCVSDTLLAIAAPCNYNIPNLAGTHSAVDNCSASNTLTFTQNPLPGTGAANASDVLITYTDQSGNSGSCTTHITPIDLTPPVLSCPPAQYVNNVALCNATITDLTSLVTLNENCTGYSFTQNPPAGTILTSGTNQVTITITDIGGNQQSCTTQFIITETIPPNVTCPASITTCNPIVHYASPSATDNCLFKLVQTDVSGLTDGDVFPIGTTTQTYTVIDSSGNTASCSFTIEVLEYPDTAQVLQDTIYLCDVFETTVNAQAITSGTGTWAVISGGATIVSPSQTTTVVQTLSSGVNRLQWVVSSPTCGTKRDTLVIIVNSSSAPAHIQDTMTVCAANGTLIQGSFPTSGYGTWSTPDGFTFDDANAAVTTIAQVPEGFSTIIWTIINPGCVNSADTGIVYLPVTSHIQTTDTSVCLGDLPFSIVGNPKSFGETSSWYVIQGQATLSSQFNANSSITAGSPGIILLVYKLTYQSCGSTTDTLAVQLVNCEDGLSDIPTLFTPNGDGDNDYFDISNLHNNYPNCEVKIINRWGNTVFESTGYATPWDGTYKGEALPMGTYFYQLSSPTNSFETVKGAISIIR